MRLIVFLIASIIQDPKPDDARIKELISQLSAEEPKVRDTATSELMAIGDPVLPFLDKARSGADAETQARIDQVIGHVTLPQKWLKDMMKEEDPSQAYNKLDEALRSKTLDKKQAVRIINAVLLSSEADTQLKQYMYSIAERHRIRDLWPTLIEMLTKDENPDENAIYQLQRLRPPKEAASMILKMIPKMRNRSMIYQLLEIVRGMKPDRAELMTAMEALLTAETDDEVKQNVLSYIVQGRLPAPLKPLVACWKRDKELRDNYLREAVLRAPPDESAKEITDLLASPEPDDVTLALDYLSRHRVPSAATALLQALERFGPDEKQVRPRLIQSLKGLAIQDPLKELLKSSGPPSRPAVLAAIGELQIRSLAPDVAACLEDKDPAVRRQAAAALAGLRYVEAAPALEARLADENHEVRRAALSSLAALRGRAATRTVLQQLFSENPDLQATAVEVLPTMDLDAVLDELTKPEALAKGITRYALANLLVKTDESTMHRVMARIGAKMSMDDLTAMVKLIQSVRYGR